MGGGIGTLSETFNIGDQRLSNEQILDKLGVTDPVLAEVIRKHIGGRETFH